MTPLQKGMSPRIDTNFYLERLCKSVKSVVLAVKSWMEYMVVIEQDEDSYGAYGPDLPGCVAAGDTREEVLELMQEAIVLHLEMLRDDGIAIPQPHSASEYVAVAA